MGNSKIICLWWLTDKKFKVRFENLNLTLKIGVLKILILISIRLNRNDKVLRISSKELLLDSKVVFASLDWLSEIKIVTLINVNNMCSKKEYFVKYCFQENKNQKLYEDCWVELPIRKVLNFIKKTPNNQNLTYEAIVNYLMMIKGYKRNILNLQKLFYDEEYMDGNFIGTWRELLVKYELVEFLVVGYVDILNNHGFVAQSHG